MVIAGPLLYWCVNSPKSARVQICEDQNHCLFLPCSWASRVFVEGMFKCIQTEISFMGFSLYNVLFPFCTWNIVHDMLGPPSILSVSEGCTVPPCFFHILLVLFSKIYRSDINLFYELYIIKKALMYRDVLTAVVELLANVCQFCHVHKL